MAVLAQDDPDRGSEIRNALDRALRGVPELRPQALRVADDRDVRDGRNGPDERIPNGLRQQLVEAIGSARESVDAASRSLAELDLPDHDARSVAFSENLAYSRYRNDDGSRRDRYDNRADYQRRPLSESSPEVRQRLIEISSDWKDRLERAEGQLEPIVGQLDAAATVLDAAARTAHNIPQGRRNRARTVPDGRPGRSWEGDLGGMAAFVREQRDRMSALAASIQTGNASLDEFVLNKGADGTEGQINSARGKIITPHTIVNGADEGPPRISVLDDGIRARLDVASAGLDKLSSRLEGSGSAATGEQDPRLRTQAASNRGGHRVGE